MTTEVFEGVTPAWVRAQVAEIEKCKWDDERAHSYQDGLYSMVLEAIAKGECVEPVVCAAEALKAEDIDFCRWCA